MRLRGAFNIFLALVLVAVGLWFVVGGSYFSTPANNETWIGDDIYTFTITYRSDFTNVSNVSLYIAKNSTFEIGNVTNASYIQTQYSSIFLKSSVYPYTNGTSISFSVNTTGNFSKLDGNYTLVAVIYNASIVEPINITILIDNNPPNRLQLVAPLNQTFVDNTTIQFGINVSDSMSGNRSYGNLINCTFNVNGTGSVRFYTNNSVVVINNTYLQNSTYWFNVSATNFDSGYHVWNISCVDYNNNVNSSVSVLGQNSVRYGGNFTLTDTIGPTTSAPTLSASSVTEGGSVTITCTGTDSITANPTEKISIRGPLNADWQEGIGTSPYTFTGTNDVGTYTSKCYSIDTAGMQGGPSAETTFAVTKSAGSSQTSSGSSGGTTGPTVSVNVFAGQTKDLGAIADGTGIINAYQASTVMFSVTTSSGGTTASSHSIKFDEVSYIEGTATVTISSDPITLTLNVGDVKEVDVDSDGTNDLEVNLKSIDENGQVNLVVRDISVLPSEEATEGTTSTTEEAKVGMSWIWWVLIVIVIVVIIALLLPKKKR